MIELRQNIVAIRIRFPNLPYLCYVLCFLLKFSFEERYPVCFGPKRGYVTCLIKFDKIFDLHPALKGTTRKTTLS